MKTAIPITFLLCTALLSPLCFADFWVSPAGDDASDGSEKTPFATLHRARDAVRALHQADTYPGGGVTVWLGDGVYPLVEGFVLEERDSGAEGAPVVYRAVNRRKARLMGGIEVPAESFRKVSDRSTLDRLDAAARETVFYADLKALGIDEYGTFPEVYQEPPALPEVFFNEQRMTLAKWPNEGWATVDKVVESGPAPWRHHESDKPGTFQYSGDRPKRWATAPGVWLHGYWCFDWRSETIKAAGIDTGKRHITFVRPHCYGIGRGNPAPRRYQAINLLEELDEPGEYYLDRETGRLFFWPPAALEGSRVVLSLATEPMIRFSNASHVTIRELVVESCAGTAIKGANGAHITIAACLIRNTGLDGIDLDGGTNHTVVACDIHDTGTAGVRIRGGDRQTLTPSGHRVVNNHIHHISHRQRTGAYHIHLKGVGILAAHNLVHDAPHQSINIMGNDHVVEFNEFHHISMASDDCGAYYMGRNPSERGTVIRYNYWHDTGSDFSHGSCAIYFDDGSGGQTVYGNVFVRAAGGHFGAVFVHGGHDNIVENNIFVDCKLAIRQAPWKDSAWIEYLKNEDRQNKLVKDIDISNPPYVTRYPELKGFMDYTGGPRLNKAMRNVVVNCEDFILGDWIIHDNLVTDRDPGFVDADGGDYALKENSVVYRQIQGFKPIPFGRIGLYNDELRPE